MSYKSDRAPECGNCSYASASECSVLAFIRDEIAKQIGELQTKSGLAIAAHLKSEIKSDLSDLRRDVNNLQKSLDHCLLQQQELSRELAAVKSNVEGLRNENEAKRKVESTPYDFPRIPSCSTSLSPSIEEIHAEWEYRRRRASNWVFRNGPEPYSVRSFGSGVEDLSSRTLGSAFRHVKTRPLKVIIHTPEPLSKIEESSSHASKSPSLKRSRLCEPERRESKEIVYKQEESTFVDLDDRYFGEKSAETNASDAAPVAEPPAPKKPEPKPSTQIVVKKRGRPKNPNKQGKKKSQSSRRLWEFLRDLLSDPKTCPSMIKWENIDEGMFRFVQSDTVAKIWGSRKGNKEMSYEKLSRAMRYYYKSGVLQPVYGRRLVYKFGPKATGWRVTDPNFEMKRAHDRASTV